MLNGWELLTEKESALIEKGIMKNDVFGGPFHLSLFPTNKCNLNCFFCYTEHLRENGRELEWDILKKALEDGVNLGVKGVSFGGGGEAFIHKNFDDILTFLEKNNLTIDSIKTNGTAMSAERAKKIIARKLKRITISLNETEPDAYSKMGRCTTHLFNKAISGIKNIVSAKKEAGSDVEISIQVFIWRENFRRLEEKIKDALAAGADIVFLNAIDNLSIENKLNEKEKTEFKNMIPDIMKKYAKLIQYNFSAEGLQEFMNIEQFKIYPEAIQLPDICKTNRRIEFCNIGWHSPVIGGTGDVFPCCHFSNEFHKSFGNLHEKSLKEIWHGEKARKFRSEMRHLLLTRADKNLLPRKSDFISGLCLERAACAFNFYLSSPDFYYKINNWAESGAAGVYIKKQKIKKRIINVLRKVKLFIGK